MKVAMWGVGIFILGLLGIVLISLFGNITVTNQLNYTTMKNAVEASMYDALDIAHYRAGFCICSPKITNNDSRIVFSDDTEYELHDITYDEERNPKCPTENNCRILYGEYRVNPQVFSESLVRRVANVVNNNKTYHIIVQDIIEYPPKVSVRIDSDDEEFSPTDKESGGYTITNQIDAIIETDGRVTVSVVNVPTLNVIIPEVPIATLEQTEDTPKTTNENQTENQTQTQTEQTQSTCRWSYRQTTVNCTVKDEYKRTATGRMIKTLNAGSGFNSCAEAESACKSAAEQLCGYMYDAHVTCTGYQTMRYVTSKGTQGTWTNTCNRIITCSDRSKLNYQSCGCA